MLFPRRLVTLAPGVLLPMALAALATLVSRQIASAAASPALIATGCGMALAPLLPHSERLTPGLAFAGRTLLRFAVVLLGLQMALTQIVAFGWSGFALAAASLFATFFAMRAAGRLLGVEPRLAELLAAGTAICGASAIAAVNSVTKGRDEEVAYALAMVTLCGTLAMLADPLIGAALNLSPALYGRWVGASVHEVAQAIGAALPAGGVALDNATLTKLSRVALLAPLVTVLHLRRASPEAGEQRVPLFVVGFLACAGFASLVPLSAELKALAGQISSFLLASALAALGLRTRMSDLRRAGFKPLALAALGALFIAAFALILAVLLPQGTA